MTSSLRLLPSGILALTVVLAGCGTGSPRFTTKETGKAGTIESEPLQLMGVASYYADEFHGRTTANGETFDMNSLTAAHRTLPFNTILKVTNLENRKTVVVRVNDRGPFKDDRIIDLSLGAAKAVGMIANGTAQVSLEIIEMGSSGK